MYYLKLLQWVPEITHHCPKTPFLIVGLEIELRDDPVIIERLAKVKQKPVTVDEGEKLAHELRARKYVECSAFTQKGLKNVFDEAVLTGLEPPEPVGRRKWFHMPNISFATLFQSESHCSLCVSVATECHSCICVHSWQLGGSEGPALLSEKAVQPPKQEVNVYLH